ncbi:MAG: PLD nuclease N-terminal domain-containing protein [Candidatus Promineifilaceae bacterium]|nr:PLD nuclease N-terminal domain-containing protein [Candidatus Promineifilaceae bacterium]
MSEEVVQTLLDLLPLLIPLLIVQWALVIAALWDLIKREQTQGPKWLWLLIILLVNLFGPIVYFLVGRDETL